MEDNKLNITGVNATPSGDAPIIDMNPSRLSSGGEHRPQLSFNYPKPQKKANIKVIGVGGCGGNATTDMYQAKVSGVSYLLLNTDQQDLDKSAVPDKLLLGPTVTRGLGSGDLPEKGRKAAEESFQEIYDKLNDGCTEMVFITAGMGKGTGTGASPVVARIAKKELGLLTIAVVTIPFSADGRDQIIKALRGLEELHKEVDALMVISNERMLEAYKGLTFPAALQKANEVLINAVRSISEIIWKQGYQNADLNDIRTTLENGNVAIVSTGTASGPNRMQEAIDKALRSPLLNNNNVEQARRILIAVYHSKDERYALRIEEQSVITDFTRTLQSGYACIRAYYYDDTLKDSMRVTIVASGFAPEATYEFLGLKQEESDPMESYQRAYKKKEDDLLISKYYKLEEIGSGVKSSTTPFVFTLDELDDDAFIHAVENQPAFRREHFLLEEMRKSKNSHKLRRVPSHILESEELFAEKTSEENDGISVINNFF